MDHYRHLHLVGVDAEALRPGILQSQNRTRGVGSTRTHRGATYHYRYHRGVFVARLDSAGEEGDLAARRAIQAEVRHSMVRIIWKNDALLPNQGHTLNE